MRAAQENAERRRRWLMIGGVVAALAVVVGVAFALQVQRDTTDPDAAVPAGATEEYGVPLGESSAPTTVAVYEDFLCPVCGVFEEAVSDELRAAVDDGRIVLEYRVVAFLDRASEDEYSTRAANAAAVVLDAAGEDAYAAFHDLLFAHQPAEGGPGLSDDELVDFAVQAGATEADVRAGIEGRAFEGWVRNATDAMSRAGVTGTPTVFLDGEVVEGETLQDVVNQTLAAAQED